MEECWPENECLCQSMPAFGQAYDKPVKRLGPPDLAGEVDARFGILSEFEQVPFNLLNCAEAIPPNLCRIDPAGATGSIAAAVRHDCRARRSSLRLPSTIGLAARRPKVKIGEAMKHASRLIFEPPRIRRAVEVLSSMRMSMARSNSR